MIPVREIDGMSLCNFKKVERFHTLGHLIITVGEQQVRNMNLHICRFIYLTIIISSFNTMMVSVTGYEYIIYTEALYVGFRISV